MDQTTEKALKLVNLIRAAFGVAPLSEMPPGQLGDSCECPVARALVPCGSPMIDGTAAFRTRVDAGLAEQALGGQRIVPAETLIGGWVVVLPGALCAFIDNFDEGMYPELIEDAIVKEA